MVVLIWPGDLMLIIFFVPNLRCTENTFPIENMKTNCLKNNAYTVLSKKQKSKIHVSFYRTWDV